MIHRLKQWLSKDCKNDILAEIAKLQQDLATIRSLADDELRGMIVDIKFDTMASIEQIKARVAELERKDKLNSKSTTGKFILSYIMGDKDLPNPSEVLKH